MQWLGKGAVVAFGHHSALASRSPPPAGMGMAPIRAGRASGRDTGARLGHQPAILLLPRPAVPDRAVRRAIFLTTAAASPIELAVRLRTVRPTGWMACPIRRGRQRQSGTGDPDPLH